ncbi:MAG: hypothetical protein AABX90_04000 [Nanoarchaeota archaeon]
MVNKAVISLRYSSAERHASTAAVAREVLPLEEIGEKEICRFMTFNAPTNTTLKGCNYGEWSYATKNYRNRKL